MLSTDREYRIRKVLNATAPNPEVESDGIRADIIDAVWPTGATPPTGSGQTWPGRGFTDTAGNVWAHTGTRWIMLTAQGATPSSLNGYTVDATSYVQRIGNMIHFAAVVSRSAGITAVEVASIPSAFAPDSSVTLAGIASQGGSAQLATVVVGASGNVRNWTAAAPNQNLAFSGAWRAKS